MNKELVLNQITACLTCTEDTLNAIEKAERSVNRGIGGRVALAKTELQRSSHWLHDAYDLILLNQHEEENVAGTT